MDTVPIFQGQPVYSSSPSQFSQLRQFTNTEQRIQELESVLLLSSKTEQQEIEAKTFSELKLHITYLKQYYPEDLDLAQFNTITPLTSSSGKHRELNTEEFDKWVKAHADENVQTVLAEIKGNITHVSLQEFHLHFLETLTALAPYLKSSQSEVILVNDLEAKSTPWLFRIAENDKEKGGAGVKLPQKLMVGEISLKLINLKTPSTIIFLDDASYSGQQIATRMERILKGHQSKEFKVQFIIACVYMTEPAEARIRKAVQNKANVECIILPHQEIKTIQEIFQSSPEKINLLNALWYLDEKIAPSKAPKPTEEASSSSSSTNLNDSLNMKVKYSAIERLKQQARKTKVDAMSDTSGTAGDDKLSTRGCASRGLTYFEHKIADLQSFPEAIESGIIIDKGLPQKEKGEFQIIPKLPPPYRLMNNVNRIIELMEKLHFASITQNK